MSKTKVKTAIVMGSSNIEIQIPYNLPPDWQGPEKVTARIEMKLSGETVFLRVYGPRELPFEIGDVVIPRFQLGFGGGGLNIAVGLNRLEPEEEVFFISPFGEDEGGELTRQFCEDQGIKTLSLPQKESSIAINLISGDGRHVLVGCRQPHQTILADEFLPPTCDQILGGGLREMDYPLFQKIQSYYGSPTYIAPRPAFVLMQDLRIFGLQLNESEVTRLNFPSVEKAAQILRNKADLLLITCSGNGGLFCYEDETLKYDALDLPEPIKDRTGAGDAMLAAFASEFGRTGDHFRALDFARGASAKVCREIGGPMKCSRLEIESLLAA